MVNDISAKTSLSGHTWLEDPVQPERLFFCYCCGAHKMEHFCNLCNGRACYRCLEWEYECRDFGGHYCTLAHKAKRACTHPEVNRL